MAAVPAALIILAQAASNTPSDSPVYGPAAAPPSKSIAPLKSTPSQCPTAATTDPKAGPIIVCAIKPQGYRIDPDILQARRLKKKGDAGRPNNPHESYADHSCANVGPMGCRGGPTINVVAAAVSAATMIEKAVKGENVGQKFVTDPGHTSEYQLYQQARREREQKETDAAAQAVSDAAKAKAAAELAKAKPAVDAARPLQSSQSQAGEQASSQQ